MGDDAIARILLPEAEYDDDRGRIVALPSFRAEGALVIESRRGSVRGNHLHHRESHLMHVLSGEMIYLERTSDGGLFTARLRPGEAVVSPRGAAHCTLFPEDSVLVVLSDVDRRGRRYEEEIVRVAPLQDDVDLPALFGDTDFVGMREVIRRESGE
jgi:oxalate decarboxylase/phosphoglucose isomerase-like protein (cupin superfamily)